MESQNRKVAEEVEKSYRLLPCVAYNASVGQSATAEVLQSEIHKWYFAFYLLTYLLTYSLQDQKDIVNVLL